MTTPIVCLSKNRADEKLAKTLVQASACSEDFRKRFWAIVEPQDIEKYKAVFPFIKYIELPRNDGGLVFARQYALTLFTGNEKPFWMLDDDISSFGVTKGNKVVKKTMEEIFVRAEELLKMAQDALGPQRILGQAAMEYQQFAWSATKDVGWRGYCDVAVWINSPALNGAVSYRQEMVLKEDRDFTLQVLAQGCETARLRTVAFACPKNGSNAGGLKELYGQIGREEAAVDRMVKAWPRVVSKQLKTDGRIDCKIDWKNAFVAQPV